MKTECIYADENHQERILYIDELVTIEYSNDEIHYMNNNSRLFREVRRASREHRLFCTCGCKSNLQLVAGDKSITTQRFFRNYKDFVNPNCCYDESPVTQKSKILLRAWLNQTLQKHLLNDIPIAEINKGNRKYELTYYAQEYDFGLVYANEAQNIPFEKIQELDEYKEMHILYLSDIHNLLQSGQLPIHQIDMQDKQGYCLFLKINEPEKDEYLLSDATLVCMYYIRENLDSGVWVGLPILEDCIMEFSVSSQGTLFYKEKPVDTYRDIVKEQYIEQVNARIQEEAMRKAANSADEIRLGQFDREDFAEPYHTTSAATRQQTCNYPDQNSLKITVKRIIEKRLEKYSDIIFHVNTDWLEETIIDGSRCIRIDLDSIDTKSAEVLSQMQLYTGTHKSITRINRRILFKGYA
ncbi:MAG: hypothetical protein K2N44_06545 [Lachnospiraceae bacterium]|nr:hypothetical protein [Lachnospiraceae bacterium]